jgi:DNA invertase Pin-like site-specific DNA recombinase
MANGQVVGYKRVSSIGQNLDRQLDGLTLDRIFEEKVSGKDTNRPELLAMLSYVREGDEVVVHSMDRLARNLSDLLSIVNSLTGRGVKVRFEKEHLVFSGQDDPMSKLMLSMMGAFSEFERSIIKQRQHEGIALAKKRGAYKGRKPSLDRSQAEALRLRISAGESKAKLAREYGISRETLYKYLRENGISQAN